MDGLKKRRLNRAVGGKPRDEMVDEMEKEEELAHSLHLCVERIRIPVFRVREQVALQVMVNLATMAVCLPLCRLL